MRGRREQELVFVAGTRGWEQSAAYILDTHPEVEAFVKNAGLGSKTNWPT